jgi:4-carboxymuconolactone decarboxylase
MTSELYDIGLATRREVIGREKVDALLARADDFTQPMQDLVTEFCWGAIWSRPGLDRRSRSILNIGMLAALNRPEALSGHILAGISNGLTKDEIQECLLQVAVYVGVPAGLAVFSIAEKAFAEAGI